MALWIPAVSHKLDKHSRLSATESQSDILKELKISVAAPGNLDLYQQYIAGYG